MREPVQIVEIDQKFCSRTYGSSPCAAALGVTGQDRCYNTLRTCQDNANYSATTVTLRFTHAKNVVENGVIPSLLNVSSVPTQINAGGASRNKKALGVRGSLTVTFQDHPYSDYFVDPYRESRNYVASDQGTFWSKWLARNPFYRNTIIRVIDGYADGSISSTKAYIIDNIAGPDSRGRVTVKAKDILSLADDKKAQAPAVSNGKLIVDLSLTATTIRVTGADAGEYPAPGYVRVGKEVIYYTGVTTVSAFEINLTGCIRARYGTEGNDHSADDRVQYCLEYIDQPIYQVVNDLLTNYGKVPPSFINLAAWQSENDMWLSPFNLSNLITEPTGVTKLLYEICEQTLSYIWYDERQQTIRFQAVKPATEAPYRLNCNDHILADSTKVIREEDERFSQVWLFHGQRDPTKKLDDNANWLRLRVSADGENPYEENQIKKIYARWLQTDAQAGSICNRLLSRYKRTPIYLHVSLDAKDGEIWTGDICDITHDEIVDFTGAPLETRFQVMSAEEIESGHKISYKLINFVYFGKSAFWMDASTTDYASSDQARRDAGLFWASAEGTINGDDGYNWS